MKKAMPVAILLLTILTGWGPAWGAEPIKLGAFFDLTGPSSAQEVFREAAIKSFDPAR